MRARARPAALVRAMGSWARMGGRHEGTVGYGSGCIVDPGGTMAKREQSGDVIVKPGRPERSFPWRLWLYAILMTGLAGGAGYLAWTYRAKALTADQASEVAVKERTGCISDLAAIQLTLEDQTKTGS